jgi:hypothetical protein
MDKLDAEEEATNLEKQFAEVLTGLSPEDGVPVEAYERILSALRGSHANERRLGATLRSLNNEVISNGELPASLMLRTFVGPLRPLPPVIAH